jgi:hypothetical protein
MMSEDRNMVLRCGWEHLNPAKYRTCPAYGSKFCREECPYGRHRTQEEYEKDKKEEEKWDSILARRGL